ncbi:hypothetical protein DXG01_010381 [Tephrocybe rancida]|nr:hypothetical protein DXG01_010381 [Tephrocybe rancida]
MKVASASMSMALLAPAFEPDELDAATARLIAQLLLQDIADISQTRKGKARADAPLSDEELAFRIQSEIWENAARTASDHAMARSLNTAIDSDYRVLRAASIAEQAAEDDRRAAEALHNGGQLPPLSDAQRLVEDPSFSALADPEPVAKENAHASSSKIVMPQTVTSIIPSKVSISKGKARAIEAKPEPRPPRVECTSCGDPVKPYAYLNGPCGHAYCGTCVSDLIKAAIRDESLYPPRCCAQPFPHAAVIPFISSKLLETYKMKRMELDVPAASRVFCPTPTCSTFLGSSEATQKDIKCEKCGISVCSKCRQAAHPGNDCIENQSMVDLRKLAKSEKWQTCPGCKAIVELNVESTLENSDVDDEN